MSQSHKSLGFLLEGVLLMNIFVIVVTTFFASVFVFVFDFIGLVMSQMSQYHQMSQSNGHKSLGLLFESVL